MKFEVFMCNCHGEGINVEKFDNNEIYLSLFYRCYNYPISIKERIRYCWNILKTGKPFNDQMILDNQTAEQLGRILINLGENNESNT